MASETSTAFTHDVQSSTTAHRRRRPVGATRTLGLTLAPDPSAPAAARHALRDALEGAGVTSEVSDTVVLLADELVTNAVLHARTSLRVELFIGAEELRVVVTDGSRLVPHPRVDVVLASVGGDTANELADSGRGLRLVELLASAWGSEPIRSGKRMWFTVQLNRG